jgi:hypothetical protein
MSILPLYAHLGHLASQRAAAGPTYRQYGAGMRLPLWHYTVYINSKCPKPVAIMLLDPKRLIDRSIADLTQLSALLMAEISDDAALRSPELRACEEAVATIDCLIPRLQVARNARIAPLRSGTCPNCDD